MLLQLTQVGRPFEHSKEKQTLALRLINFHGMSIEVVDGFQMRTKTTGLTMVYSLRS